MADQATSASAPLQAQSGISRRAGSLVEGMVIEAGIRLGRDLIVHDPGMWGDWAARGMLGIGESYMQGKWDAPRVDEVMSRLARLPSSAKRKLFKSWRNRMVLAVNVALNPQKPSRELMVAREHYNLGNDFFASWLDPHMQYSCAYFSDKDQTLEAAQVAKMRLIGEKLKLKPGMTVLDIGCGWGGLGRFLIREYDVRVFGVNISAEQMRYCREQAKAQGMSEFFTCLEQSYRNIEGCFDRIVSVGMFEHVGPKNYAEFFSICQRALKDDGLMLLHTIGSNASQDALNDRWITSYIFPNGTLPSIAQIGRAVERKLVIEDLHNLGPHYDRTLMHWYERFSAVKPALNLDKTFARMWDFFLLYSAAGFRERKTQLWQFVMSKKCTDCYCGAR